LEIATPYDGSFVQKSGGFPPDFLLFTSKA